MARCVIARLVTVGQATINRKGVDVVKRIVVNSGDFKAFGKVVVVKIVPFNPSYLNPLFEAHGAVGTRIIVRLHPSDHAVWIVEGRTPITRV
jgi:hypothetical protein